MCMCQTWSAVFPCHFCNRFSIRGVCLGLLLEPIAMFKSENLAIVVPLLMVLQRVLSVYCLAESAKTSS